MCEVRTSDHFTKGTQFLEEYTFYILKWWHLYIYLGFIYRLV